MEKCFALLRHLHSRVQDKRGRSAKDAATINILKGTG